MSCGNLDKHCDRQLNTHQNEPQTVEKYDKIKFEAHNSLIRAINTYERFKDLYVKGGTYELAERQSDINASIKA